MGSRKFKVCVISNKREREGQRIAIEDVKREAAK
jgi:hypothetical protein